MVLEAIEEFKRERTAPPADESNAQPLTNCAGHTVHLALVVPDIRLYQLLKQKAVIVNPIDTAINVNLHILVADTKDPLHDLGWDIRVALAQLGLVLPEDVHLTYPDQVTLGWPAAQETP